MNYEDPGWESVYSSSSTAVLDSFSTAASPTTPTSPPRGRVRARVPRSDFLSPERGATASGSAASTSASTLRVRPTLRSRAGSTNTALSSRATSNTDTGAGAAASVSATEEDDAYSSDDKKAKAKYHSRKKATGLSKTHPLIPSTGASPSTTPGLWRATEGRFSSEEETRPRWLVDAKASAERKDAQGKRRAATDSGEVDELEVLEHKILPTDSLAGVALKYGVTVAQIRKCNKMWASDSIHLRKFLYIPLHTADTSKLHVHSVSTSGSTSPAASATSFISPSPGHAIESQYHTAVGDALGRVPSASLLDAPIEPSEECNLTNAGLVKGATIKRIPISELSFFPPPTQPSTDRPDLSALSLSTLPPLPTILGTGVRPFHTLRPAPVIHMNHGRAATSGGRHGGSVAERAADGVQSLFNVFSDLSRLSMDSNLSNGSTVTNGGEDDLDGDGLVELDRLEGRTARKGKSRARPRDTLFPPQFDDRPTFGGVGARKGKQRVVTEQLAPTKGMELPKVLIRYPGGELDDQHWSDSSERW